MDADNRQSQLSELEALESVLRENRLKSLSDWKNPDALIKGIVQVDFEYNTGDPIEFRCYIRYDDDELVCQIKLLPPVRLVFRLPRDYPSDSSPMVKVISEWMTEKQHLACENAINTILEGNKGMMVIYLCYQSVLDTLTAMNIKFINLNRSYHLKISPGVPLRFLRETVLLELDKVTNEAFSTQFFDCQICFETVYGRECFKFLPCEHVTCKNCVKGFYQNVAKGMISSRFTCLSIDCKTEAHDELLREALEEELYKKYDEALLEKAIAEMGNTTECARETCKMLSYITDKEKNLVECSYCGYTFCHLCKQTFHGVSPCKIRAEDVAEIVKTWQEGDDEERAELSKKYGGEKVIEEWVTQVLNGQWMNENTKSCPGCNVKIEKSDGCNKMHCAKCNVSFCWLCERTINNGYAHFEAGGFCNGKLFEGLIPDDY